MCIIMSNMKSVMGKSFTSILFYSNLKYGKFRRTEPVTYTFFL